MRIIPFGRQMSSAWRRRGWKPVSVSAALVSLLAFSGVALAQETAVGGVVIGEGSLRPLPGAQVVVEGTERGTLTDAAGRFLLPGLTGTQVTLRVVMLGYRSATRVAQVGDMNVRIALTEAAVPLDEVVVTGTAGGTQRRALANAVSTLNVADVTEVAAAANVQQLLNARVAGVIIQPATGGVGTGAKIRVRGASSLTLPNEPLIYVDGVRIDNRAATGPISQGFESSSISRWNDINPDEIETIEIIKGPAAATLYGTEAANGVIQIITKRGSAGAPRWNLTVRQGMNYLQNPEGIFPTNYQIVPEADRQAAIEAGGRLVDSERGVMSIDIVELERQRGNRIFHRGHLQEYDLNLSGGTDVVRYFASAGMERNQGAEPSNQVERYNARLNLSVAPSDRLDLAASFGYIDGHTRVSAEGGWGGRVWGVVLANPQNLVDPRRRGYHSGTPEAYDLMYNFWQDVNRFTGSLQVNHRPTDWLRHRLVFGADQSRMDDIIFLPRVDTLIPYGAWGNEARGRRDNTAHNVRVHTVDYSATGNLTLTPGLTSSTSVGAQYYTNFRERLFAQGFVFPAQGLSAIAATTVNRRNDHEIVEDRTLGFFIQEQIGWQDRVFLTAGVRMDDNSAFGENFTRVYYPKFGASWVISEEPFWRLPFVNTLKLRAAYGESGLQPQTFAALRTFEPTTGPGDAPAVTPQFIGNPDLGPERGKEVELGFDAGLLEDRIGIEFTYYNQRTDDAILQRAVAPSVGFSGLQFFNAGEIRNRGVELLTRARVLELQNVAWDLSLNLANHDSEVIRLGPGEEWVGAGTFLRHQIGYPVGSWFERRVVSAELDAEGNAINVLCDDGQGGGVACANAPQVFLGRTVPKLEGGFSSTVTLFDRLRLYGLLDFKRNYRRIDGNTRIRTIFFGGRAREVFFPQETDPRRAAAIQAGGSLVDFLIDDASFTKLREVSASYTLPQQFAGRVGASQATFTLSGRNLHTWTNFGGIEPEATWLGGTRGGGHNLWDQAMLPQLTTWVATINLNF